VTDWLKGFLETLLPFSCHLCRKSVPFGNVVCLSCKASLKKELRAPFRISDVVTGFPVWCLGNYETLLAEAIKTIKYKPSKRLFAQTEDLLENLFAAPSDFPKIDVFVPVPLHPSRAEKRGFNQAELLARKFAEILKCPSSPVLVRTRITKPQADCEGEERKTNLKDAFSLAPGLRVSAFEKSRICLVDDVATTGSTLHECGKKLLDLKPSFVCGLVLAHAPKLFQR